MWSQPGAAYPSPQFPIRWDLAWKGALLCGVGAAVLTSLLPYGCCLWMVGAGALSVVLYRRQLGDTPITPGMGLRVGALAGGFGFLVSAAFYTASFIALRSSGEFRRAFEAQMQSRLQNNPSPEMQQAVHTAMDWMSTPRGAATAMIILLVILAAAFVLFCGAGGALGASMSGRRRPPR